MSAATEYRTGLSIGWWRTGGALLGAACLAAATGWLVVRSPIAAGAVAAPLALAAVLMSISPRKLIAGFIVYFPLENIVLNAVPSPLVAPIRYAPELVGVGAAAVLLIRHGRRLVAPLRPLLAPIVLIFGVSLVSWLESSFAFTTAVIGVRSELRFLPYVVVAVAVLEANRDVRLIGRAVCVAAGLQCMIAVAQVAGGPAVAKFFVPHYSVTIGGTDVQPAGEFRAHTVFGSLTNYNHLAIFLVFALAITYAIGPGRLGLAIWSWRALMAADLAVILLTGSREGLLAAVVAGLVFLRVRRGVGMPALVVLSVIAVAVAAPFAPQGTGSAFASRSLIARWQALFDPSAYSSNPGSPNFRLTLIRSEADIASRVGLAFGDGPGSIVDRRTLDDGMNPLYLTTVGQEAIAFSYQYDGNWGLLLVEVGVVGLITYVFLLAAVGRVAWRGRSVWANEALLAIVFALVPLGFFTAILQLRLPSFIFWVLVGLAAGHRRDGTAKTSIDRLPTP
jgi:hypothetical protein